MDSFNFLFSVASFASDSETTSEPSTPVDFDGTGNSGMGCIVA
jgi:hypothetical protein